MRSTADLRRCRRLVREIERLGGPPAHQAEQFAQVKAGLERGGDLGFVFMVPLAVGSAIGIGMVLFWLSDLLEETKGTVTEGSKRMINTMATAGQVLIWGGVAWLGWQAFFVGAR